jgi:hypothetical protein
MNARQTSKSNAGVGLVPRADQLEFDKEEKHVEQFEKANEKFYRDVKSYIKKIDELCKSENKLISDLTHTIANAAPASEQQQDSAWSSSSPCANYDSEHAFVNKLKVSCAKFSGQSAR